MTGQGVRKRSWGSLILAAALAVGLAGAADAAAQTKSKVRHPAKGKPAKHAIHKLNLNAATEAQLAALKPVGPDWAKKIVAARPYGSVDELAKAGMGKPAINAARPFLTVGGRNGRWRRPAYRLAPGEKVNINTAELKVLIALPGIGPYRARAVVANRPFARLEDIMKVNGIKKKEFAKIRNLIIVK
jgi:competence ComEA-like helix-hairpin-helix protein